MKEKILQIIANQNACCQYHSNEKSASEIESHVFEFVEWCIINACHTPLGYTVLDESVEELNVEQLYDWWWNNVKNKSEK